MNDYNMNNQDYRNSAVEGAPSEVVTNSVLKNTYMLLAMTLAFSGAMAYAAIVLNIGLISPWIFLGGVIGLQFLIHYTANSSFGIIATFLFTGFMGFATGPFLNTVISGLANGSELIMISAGGTAMIFFALSGYVLTTRRDMSFISGALVTGSLVALISLIISLVFNLPALHLATCVLFMLIASGMIMYQTSAIIHSGETNYVIATLALYLSIYNLFMTIIQLLVYFMGDR